MELRLLRPLDQHCPEFHTEQAGRLRDRWEFSNDLEWAVYQAKVFYEVFSDVQKASELLEQALEADPENADLLACLAECYSRLPDKLALARDFCTRSLARDGESDYAHTIMARLHAALGKPVDSYRSAMAALKLNTHNFEAGVYLGIVGFALAQAEGDTEEMARSMENLRITLSLNTGSPLLQDIIEDNERRLAAMKTD